MIRKPGVWLLVLIAAATSVAQDDVRTQKTNGISLKLPRGWEWAVRAGDNIGVKIKLQIGTRDEEITGEMFCTSGAYVGTRVEELTGAAKTNPADHKSFAVKESQRFGSQRNVALVTYVKERGSDPVRLYQRRHWIFRKGTILYEWREEWPRKAAGKAAGLSSVQKAIKFSTPQGAEQPDKQRDFVNQRVRYKVAPDWIWSRGKPGKKVKLGIGQNSNDLLFTARSEMLVKGQRWYLGVGLQAIKTSNTVKQVAEFNKNSILKNWTDVKGYVFEDRVPFCGEKAHMITFTGVNEKTGTKERLFVRYFYFKHKGHVFVWDELGAARGKKAAVRALKKARKGLKTY
ncbi:MAG: hypothetical protein CL908_20020 [Deltaproteobacteria bacterium]|nr:hypothetical protein [Deltaproteobacteria bacterium]